MGKTPWEIDSGLEYECLCEIASIIKKIRNETMLSYDHEKGDEWWSMNCRVYEKTINKIEQSSKAFPWLKVDRQNQAFTMLINDVPVKFYRGDPAKPGKRRLRQGIPEIKARQMLFEFGKKEVFLIWRFAVETETDGSVLRIVMAQYDMGRNCHCIWEVPLDDKVSTVYDIKSAKRESVVLNKPAVKPKIKKTDKIIKNA